MSDIDSDEFDAKDITWRGLNALTPAQPTHAFIYDDSGTTSHCEVIVLSDTAPEPRTAHETIKIKGKWMPISVLWESKK